MHTQIPSIALVSEAWQEYRSLPPPDTYEREHAYGNLQSLLMTFTICLPFFRESLRFGETTAPLLRATIMAVLIQLRQPVSCMLSCTNVPSLTKAVKQSNGHPNSGE